MDLTVGPGPPLNGFDLSVRDGDGVVSDGQRLLAELAVVPTGNPGTRRPPAACGGLVVPKDRGRHVGHRRSQFPRLKLDEVPDQVAEGSVGVEGEMHSIEPKGLLEVVSPVFLSSLG